MTLTFYKFLSSYFWNCPVLEYLLRYFSGCPIPKLPDSGSPRGCNKTFLTLTWCVRYIDSVVEHWHQILPSSADTVTSVATVSATECHRGDSDADVDMTEIKAENERRLAAMTEEDIVAKQKQLLSALGNLGAALLAVYTHQSINPM